MNSALTQISRKKLSAPMVKIAEFLEESEVQGLSILHFGEGKAYQDTRELERFGKAEGYDPNSPIKEHRKLSRTQFDLGVAIYVFNTLPPVQRRVAFDDLKWMVGRWIIAVRADRVYGEPMFDGVKTKRGTFQKQYNIGQAVREFGGTVIADAPGYVILTGESKWTS